MKRQLWVVFFIAIFVVCFATGATVMRKIEVKIGEEMLTYSE